MKKRTAMMLAATATMFTVMFSALPAMAKVQSREVTYKEGGTVLKGYVAWDDAVEGDRPGVLVVHQWMGLTDYEKMRANMLAELGYVAFCADIYGEGIRPSNMKEAGAQATIYRSDLPLMRKRVQAGLDQMLTMEQVDSNRVAAIGYCFGGGVVLELARSGADVAGVVSFHGSLNTSLPADAETLKAKALVLHGAVDPYVPAKDVEAFMAEMNAANADWQMVHYSGAVHSFTQKHAGSDPSAGAAYNEAADHRSWAHMRVFFAELFAK